MTYEEAVAMMTAPGAMFEMETGEMNGRPVRDFKHRERSMREKVANAAGRGDEPFMVHAGRTFSYARFGRLVWGTAHRLRDSYGLEKGDRFAVLAYNCPEWVIAMFAATSVGAIGVALNGWWASEELEYGLVDSGSRYLGVDERLYPRVKALIPKLGNIERVFYIGENAPEGTVPFSELMDESSEIPTEPIDEDDPFCILYTSGTTGRAKGCITTHRGTITQVLAILFGAAVTQLSGGGELIPSEGQMASLFTSPLFHVGGLHSGLCASMTGGVKLVFLEGRFDPDKAMHLIESEGITMWPAIPTMLHRVVHSPNISNYDLSSLRSVSFGGAPTAPETIEKAREVLPMKPTLTGAYGLTECHGVATLNAGKDLLGRMTSVGRPAPFLEVKVIDEGGAELATGKLGEILMYGPTITPGYWGRPDATAETVREGWLYTGDLGYLDDEGFLFIVDRAKDMILRGGENVYCGEIEACLAEHAAIDEAAVIGVPDAEFGEKVMAVVCLAAGATLSVDEVKDHVAEHMARFKVPEIVEFISEPLPRNPAGKILKNQLRKTATG